MKGDSDLSVTQKLLVAAFSLENGGRAPFSAEDLVVAAWKAFPNTFGLRGYLDASGKLAYPDSNRVFVEIMGKKAIRERGFLKKVGEKKYILTESGQTEAKHLSAGEVDSGKSGLPRETRDRLRYLLASKAVQKVQNEDSDKLTFHEACLFWGITARSSAIDLQGKLENIRNIIETARLYLKNSTGRFNTGGDIFSEASLRLVEHTHKQLVEKFQAEIRTIQKRTDQRLLR